LFQSLTVLYLYENQISKIEGLEQAYNLEILHLQRNKVKRIENLLECRQLRILYLGYNEIDTVEGLHNLTKLEELHIENQRLPRGTSLTFDPRTLATLSNTLIVLNASGNNITHIEDLAGMEELHTLLVGNNAIKDLDSTALVIRTMNNLQVLDLRDNPIAKKPQFKERIIGYGAHIAILNDKEVTDTMRDFIQRFAAVKAVRLQNAVDAYQRGRSEYDIPKEPPPEVSVPSTPPGPSFTNVENIFSSTNQLPLPGLRTSTPTKSNLSLNLSSPDMLYRRPGGIHQSLSQINTYLSKTDTNPPRHSSTPQFILAPPKFNQADSDEAMRSKKMMSKKRTSFSLPSFKKRSSDAEEAQSETISKSSKAPADMWRSKKAVVRLLKPPAALRCSRENFLEGMPMPSKALLHLDSSDGSKDSVPLRSPTPSLSPRLKLGSSRRVAKGSSSRGKQMLHDDLQEKPPFTTSVYELPPWPHIVRRWAAEQPAVTFMP
jgi:protein phosphatase 1 regulatory subunit 42